MAPRRSLLLSCLLWLVLASSPAPTLAAPSARLTYVRAPGAERCVDEEGLRRAVATRLGYDPFFPWAKVTVIAHVRKESGTYRAEVTLVDEGGVSRGARSLSSEGDDCAPLVEALALGISLALDPLSLTRAAPPEPPPEPVAEPPRDADLPRAAPEVLAPPPVEPTVAAPRPRPRSAWSSWVGIAAGGTYGVTPGVAFGGLLRGTLERGSLSLGLEAGLDAPTSAAGPTGGRVKAWRAQGTLLGCGRVAIFVGCGLLSGGPLVASGVGLVTARSVTLAHGAVGPRLGLEWPLGARFRVEGFMQLAFTLARRALQVGGVDAYRQAVTAPSVGLGLSGKIF